MLDSTFQSCSRIPSRLTILKRLSGTAPAFPPHVDWRIEETPGLRRTFIQQDLDDLLEAGNRDALKALLLDAWPTWRVSQQPWKPRIGAAIESGRELPRDHPQGSLNPACVR